MLSFLMYFNQVNYFSLHEKPYFIFSKWSGNMVFAKKRTEIWYFMYYQKRWYFFSPKIWSYSLEGKWKTIFLKKNTWKDDIVFKCSRNIVFPKLPRRNMIFLVSSGKTVFLFLQNMKFFLGGKWRTKTYTN